MRSLVFAVFTFLVLPGFCAYPGFKKGKPDLQSIGVLEFNDEGILFIGDSQGGKIYAIDFSNEIRTPSEEQLVIADLEARVGGLLGTDASGVLIHDMAVNPVSQNVYLSVSRARGKWTSRWQLPNELADAMTLVKIEADGTMEEASLKSVNFNSISLPNPIDDTKEHEWKKGTKLRKDAISDISYHQGKLYISGLSNEEFYAAMWVTPFPFKNEVVATTLEIYHGAHGAYETQAPVRAFLPYTINNESKILAAYLCSPLVIFDTEALEDGNHIKGRTVAEFGAGSFPVDMVSYSNEKGEYILISNSALPLMILDPKDIENYKGEITSEVQGYLAGVKYTPRSGTGIYHLADYDDKYIVATQRLASGKLALTPLPKSWLQP